MSKKKHKKHKTFVLYGVAQRDSELVCMFFEKKKDAIEFAAIFPGDYDVMPLWGVPYSHIFIGTPIEVGRVMKNMPPFPMGTPKSEAIEQSFE